MEAPDGALNWRNGYISTFVPEQLTVFNELALIGNELNHFLGLIAAECRTLPEKTHLLHRGNQYFQILARIANLFDSHLKNISDVIHSCVPAEQIPNAIAAVEQLYVHRLRQLLQPRGELQWLFAAYNVYVNCDFQAFTAAIAAYHAQDHRGLRNMPTLSADKENDGLDTETLVNVERLRLDYQALVLAAVALCRASQNVNKLCAQFQLDPTHVICCDLIGAEHISRQLLVRFGLFYTVHPPAFVRVGSASECFQVRLQLWIPEELLSANIDHLLSEEPKIVIVNQQVAKNLHRKLASGIPISSTTDNMSPAFENVHPLKKEPTRQRPQDAQFRSCAGRPGPIPWVKADRLNGFTRTTCGTPSTYAEMYQCMEVPTAAKERHSSGRSGSTERSSAATEPFYLVVGLPVSVLSDWLQRLVLHSNIDRPSAAFFAAVTFRFFAATNSSQNSDAAASAFWHRMFSDITYDWFAQPCDPSLETLLSTPHGLIRSLLPAEDRANIRRLDECELRELEDAFTKKLSQNNHGVAARVTLSQFAPLTATGKDRFNNSPKSCFDLIFKFARLLSENAIACEIFNSKAMGHFLCRDKRMEFLQHDVTQRHFGIFLDSDMPGAFFLTLSANEEYPLEKLANGKLLVKIDEMTKERAPLCLGVSFSFQQWQAKLRKLKLRFLKRSREDHPSDDEFAAASTSALWKSTILVTSVELTQVEGYVLADGTLTKEMLTFTPHNVVDAGGIDAQAECGFYANADMCSMFQAPCTTTVLVGPGGVLKAELPNSESLIQVSTGVQQSASGNTFRPESTQSPFVSPMSPPRMSRRPSCSGRTPSSEGPFWPCSTPPSHMSRVATAPVIICSPFDEADSAALPWSHTQQAIQPRPISRVQPQLVAAPSQFAANYQANFAIDENGNRIFPQGAESRVIRPIEQALPTGFVFAPGGSTEAAVEATETQARKRIASQRTSALAAILPRTDAARRIFTRYCDSDVLWVKDATPDGFCGADALATAVRDACVGHTAQLVTKEEIRQFLDNYRVRSGYRQHDRGYYDSEELGRAAMLLYRLGLVVLQEEDQQGVFVSHESYVNDVTNNYIVLLLTNAGALTAGGHYEPVCLPQNRTVGSRWMHFSRALNCNMRSVTSALDRESNEFRVVDVDGEREMQQIQYQSASILSDSIASGVIQASADVLSAENAHGLTSCP